MVIGGTPAAIGAFVTASAVIVILMFAIAVLVSTAREHTIHSLRLATGKARQFGGIMLVGVGIWFIVIAIWADFFADLFPV